MSSNSGFTGGSCGWITWLWDCCALRLGLERGTTGMVIAPREFCLRYFVASEWQLMQGNSAARQVCLWTVFRSEIVPVQAVLVQKGLKV